MNPVCRFFITFFLGGLGIHKFIDYKIGMGILYLFTGGLCGIGWLIDSINAFINIFKKQPPEPISTFIETAQNRYPATAVTQIPESDKSDIATNFPSSTAESKVTENFKVAGTSYRQEELKELGYENDMYTLSKKQLIEEAPEDEPIYQYNFYPSDVKLVEEPDNPHDSNAIKVIVDGTHIGYIKSGSCSRVRNLLKSGNVLDISAEIYGGNFKVLFMNDDGEYEIERNSRDIAAKVSITHRK